LTAASFQSVSDRVIAASMKKSLIAAQLDVYMIRLTDVLVEVVISRQTEVERKGKG
jgi:hypothetical protein